MGMHDGHRARVRKRVLREGLEHLDPHNVLEILLFFCIPRGDTNELAHRILAQYDGSFAAVTEAPYEDLLRIDGVGENTAFFLKMIPQIAAFYRLSLLSEKMSLNSIEALKSYFPPRFYGKDHEELHMVSLDAALRPKHYACISVGSPTASSVDIRRIVEEAITYRAVRVIVAHNHLSGNPLPSKRDETATQEICEALKKVDVELIDHVIVAGDAICSLRDRGIFPYPHL